MKLITFYIDVVFKLIFLVFLGLIFWLSKQSLSFFDGIVTNQCTGTDITWNALWDEYKDLQNSLCMKIIYIGLPIVLILIADALYIHLRTAVKKRKKRKVKPIDNREDLKGMEGETPQKDPESQRDLIPIVSLVFVVVNFGSSSQMEPMIRIKQRTRFQSLMLMNPVKTPGSLTEVPIKSPNSRPQWRSKTWCDLVNNAYIFKFFKL